MSDEGESSRLEDLRIGGIEGGSTCSTLIVINGKGETLTRIRGPGTNHWDLGMMETAKRIDEMLTQAKSEVGMPINALFDCVGLYLSGCEEEKTNHELVETVMREYPALSREYVVGSDVIGSLKTGIANGGVVSIAGTGSNTLLQNPDGKIYTCGGWGHMLGDEGSAYWMAHRACKYVFDDIDGLVPSPHPIDHVWSAMKNYFKTTDRNGIVPYFYSDFEKNKIAHFTIKLVEGCEKDDPLCRHIFEENGRALARNVDAVARKAHDDIKHCPGGLKIICVGSVWKSWDFLKKGFLEEINERRVIDEFTLMTLTVSSALGACYEAAEKIQCFGVKGTHDKHAKAFFHYKREETCEIK